MLKVRCDIDVEPVTLELYELEVTAPREDFELEVARTVQVAKSGDVPAAGRARELYRKFSPHEYAANFKTPTLVVHGQLDYRLDVSQGFDLFTTLQRMGVPSKMLYSPDEGHWVQKPQNAQLWYKTVNDWVDEWIGK